MSRNLALTFLFVYFILVLKTSAQEVSNDTSTDANDVSTNANSTGTDMTDQSVCKKFDDTNTLADLQVFPSCNAEVLSEKILNTVRNYLNAYPFDEPKICRNETMKFIPDIMIDISQCLVGPCTETLFDTIIKEALEDEDYNNIKGASVSDIQSVLLPVAKQISETVIMPTLSTFCVPPGQKPLFLLLTPDNYTARNFAEEFLQIIEQFADALFEREEKNARIMSMDQEQCIQYTDIIKDAINNLPLTYTTLAQFGALDSLNKNAQMAVAGIVKQTPITLKQNGFQTGKIDSVLCPKESIHSSETHNTSMKVTAFGGITLMSVLVGFYML